MRDHLGPALEAGRPAWWSSRVTSDISDPRERIRVARTRYDVLWDSQSSAGVSERCQAADLSRVKIIIWDHNRPRPGSRI